MIMISNQHAGKRVRIIGIVPLTDTEYMVGSGDHVGLLEGVEGDRFRFRKDDWDRSGRLRVRLWRIAEVFPSKEEPVHSL